MRRSHSLSLIFISKPKLIGSLIAVKALETVDGETLGPEWNTVDAKEARTEGVMSLMPWEEMKFWNFFQPDSYCRMVEGL